MPDTHPMTGGTKLWLVTQKRGASWEVQGIFSSHEKAVAACRNDHYSVVEEELDLALPDETIPPLNEEWPRIYREQYQPSPLTEATSARYAARGFHGGEPNVDGSFTTDTWKIDPERRKRYYPAANAAEWYHDSARLWAIVDDLTREQADPALIDEIRRMAQRGYEIAYLWQRAALSGLPEYDGWQQEEEPKDAVPDA